PASNLSRMTSLILRIEIGRADIDTPCECSQTRRWSAVGVQTSSAAENCKRAKSDSGAGAKIVHDGPESVFTLARNGRSRCAGIGVHVGPENACWPTSVRSASHSIISQLFNALFQERANVTLSSYCHRRSGDNGPVQVFDRPGNTTCCLALSECVYPAEG